MSRRFTEVIFLICVFVLLAFADSFAQDSCYTRQIIIVNGSSMAPLILNGDELDHKIGYFNCYQPKRGDVVTYNYAGNKNLILKKIRAVPGDTFEYRNDTIFINKKPLLNSQGEVYVVRSKMLTLYSKSYPVLPENTFLLMGEKCSGTLDSSKFGLVDISDIVGKVEVNK